MCEQHIYPTVDVDGRRTKEEKHKLCSAGERYGVLCENTKKFKHPAVERRPGLNTTTYYNMPPSPPSSDSSFHLSGNEAGRSRKRRSSLYVHGAQVIDVSRKPSHREKRSNEHLFIVDPPTERSSPARQHVTPILKNPGTTRPVSYATTSRPEVRIEVNDGLTSHRSHRRQTSHSSRDSQDSGSVSDGERRVRKLKRELQKAEEVVRQQKLQSEIDRQNEAIASRPAVPSAPNPLARSYRRPSVSIRRPDHDLADAMHQLRLNEVEAEKERRRQLRRADERLRAQEDEAQKQRLKDRMTPASQRRPHKILFSDGTYRYEY